MIEPESRVGKTVRLEPWPNSAQVFRWYRLWTIGDGDGTRKRDKGRSRLLDQVLEYY